MNRRVSSEEFKRRGDSFARAMETRSTKEVLAFNTFSDRSTKLVAEWNKYKDELFGNLLQECEAGSES